MKQRITLIILIVIIFLIFGSVLFASKYFAVQKELRQAQAMLETQKINVRVLSFTSLFIGKVLKADKEIDFETRLQLENSVRNLEDQEVLTQWQKFTDSKTPDEAQAEVKNLLDLLVSKIKN